MPSLKSKAGSVKAIEKELQNLASRRDGLEKRREKAQADLDAARAERKKALAGDPNADLTKHSTAVSDALETVEAVASVIADLDEQTEDAERRLAEAQEGDARANASKELTTIASDFDAAAAELETAIKAVGKAFDKLAGVVPETIHSTRMEGSVKPDPAGLPNFAEHERNPQPHDLARAVLAEGLAAACPLAFPKVDVPFGYRLSLDRLHDPAGYAPTFMCQRGMVADPLGARKMASLLITDRLRQRAEAISSGEADPEIHTRKPYVPPEPKRIEGPIDAQIVPLLNFQWRPAEDARPHLVSKTSQPRVPVHVADAAVEAGFAHHADSPEGEELIAERKAKRDQYTGMGVLSPGMCTDLGVVRDPEDEPEEDETEPAAEGDDNADGFAEAAE